MNSLCFFLFFIICVFQFKWSRFWLRGPSYCNKVTIHIFIFQFFINKQSFTLTLMYDKWSSVVIDKTYLNIKPVVWFKPKLHSYKIAIKKKSKTNLSLMREYFSTSTLVLSTGFFLAQNSVFLLVVFMNNVSLLVVFICFLLTSSSAQPIRLFTPPSGY